MSAPYQDIVGELRVAFPKPVSDRMHDAYFVFSFLRARDQVDALESAAPMLGVPVTLDYGEALRRRVADAPLPLETVTAELVQYLSGMFIWGHPRAQINVVASPTIASLIGGLLPSIYNPNLVSEETSRRVSLAEVEAIAMTAALVGYDPAVADGVFTFGGTGTLLSGAKIGLEKVMPGTRRERLRAAPPVLVCSQRGHYANETVANWLGLGEAQVVRVPATDDNQMRLDELVKVLQRIVDGGQRIACLVAMMGTTDAFGLDDLEGIVRVRNALVAEYRLDYHKTGFAPYISSAVLVRDGRDFQRLARSEEDTPYIFHSGERHPAASRSRRRAPATASSLRSPTSACSVDKGYGEPIAALKSYILSPFSDDVHVAAVLEKDRHAVTVVDSGQAAVEAMRAPGRVDLVLMDIQMPEMDGFQATAAIRAMDGDRRSIPIVALTAHAQVGYDEVCAQAGMNGHLSKPLDRASLRRVLARVAASSSPVGRLTAA